MNETLRFIITENQKHLESPTAIVKRDLEILPVPRKATVVIGVRKCGKFTWMRDRIERLLDEGVGRENICFIDFSDDRLAFLRAPDAEPSLISDAYYQRYPQKHEERVYFFFSEIQYVNRWAQFVNRIQTSQQCEVYLTGSSAKLLSIEIATELGGRSFTWTLMPFSFREFLRFKGEGEEIVDFSSRDAAKSAFSAFLEQGGMPESLILPAETMAGQYHQALVNDVLVRDLLLRYNIPHAVQVKRLIQILMNSMSRLVTINKLKQRLAGEQKKLSGQLISEYLEKMADCFLLFTVPIRSYNLAVQAVNPKKVYAIDHALAMAFSEATGDRRGLCLENMVYIELRRRTQQIFYYKTRRGAEIDFAIGSDDAIRLIQVCWELGPTREQEVRTLTDAMEELGCSEAQIITAWEEETIVVGEKTIRVIPAYTWLLKR
jgi:predicted AAA+ superfamily ATPase